MSRTNEEHRSYILARCIPEPNSGCWLWLLSDSGNGYGNAFDGQKAVTAHRLSYRAFHGDIKPGEWVLHSCDNGMCVNPDHLYAGDHIQNMRDMARRGRQTKRKLSHAQVREARRRREMGEPRKQVARSLGVTANTILWIEKNRTYRFVR